MNNEALNIISKLIDEGKISGEDAIILIQSILNLPQNPSQYIDPNPTLGPVVIQPYRTTTTCDELINKLTRISKPDNKDIIYG